MTQTERKNILSKKNERKSRYPRKKENISKEKKSITTKENIT